MAAAAAQTKPPRIVFPSIITAITTPSSHSSSPSHWCPALEFMLLCDWVLWRSVGRAEIIYIPGSVFCRSIQCIESKGIRTDANVYHNLINQQSTRHSASVSVIERDVTKHRRDNIIIMNKKRHKQRQKSNNQLKNMRSSVFSKIVIEENTIFNIIETTINQAWLYSWDWMRLELIYWITIIILK